ncbi:MAG: IS200/IS605 family transposase [Elusimicrobiaceae bacterium]|nr:IS200/IS605 family transposase [Elusimicrobiaceae bacterium]
MANTYTQLFVHFVFAVKYRGCFIAPAWQQELYAYIIGVIENRHHKVYAIGGMRDHIHVFVSMSPTQSVSELVQETKRASTLWIKERHLVDGNFAWQEGFGAFTYGKSQVDAVAHYINNQKEHHLGKTFNEEYLDFLRLFEVKYDERYVLKSPEE